MRRNCRTATICRCGGSRRTATGACSSTSASAAAVLQADRDLNERIASVGTAHAYAAHLADQARLHRFGIMSIVGRGQIADWLGQHAVSMSAASGAADTSEAGDLGYSYGTYELKGAAPERGAYIRVWTRDA